MGEKTRCETTLGRIDNGSSSATLRVMLASSAVTPVRSLPVPARISLAPLILALSVRWYETSEAISLRTTRSHPNLKLLGRTGSPLLNVVLRSLNVHSVKSALCVHDCATIGFRSPVL